MTKRAVWRISRRAFWVTVMTVKTGDSAVIRRIEVSLPGGTYWFWGLNEDMGVFEKST